MDVALVRVAAAAVYQSHRDEGALGVQRSLRARARREGEE